MNLRTILGTLALLIIFSIGATQETQAATSESQIETFMGPGPKKSNKGCKIISKRRKQVQKNRAKAAKKGSKRRSVGTYI